jgi:peptidoglycan/LPS O-acetylase OafA/YrhL
MTARLPALDGLRAVAALLVVVTHAAYLSGFTVNGGLVGRLAGRGDFGVAIFFALSGFLLHFRLASDARDGRTDIRAYAVRRAARVLPAYWVTLAVVLAVVQPPVRTALAQALTVQTYLPGTDLDAFSQSWSIPTELSFYVVLPLVVWLLERARRRDPDLPVLLLVASAVIATVALAFVPVGTVGEDLVIERWLPARWPNFAVGMVLAELLLRRGSRLARAARRLGRDSAGCLALAVAALLLATTPVAGLLTLGPASGVQLSVRLALSTAVAGLLLAPLVLGREDDSYSAALASRPARGVGTVSYGLFLWHLPVFAGLYAFTGAQVFAGGIVPLLAVGLPISLLMAWLSHVVVERPAMRWAARRVPHRPAPLPR